MASALGLLVGLSFCALGFLVDATQPQCRCIPSHSCWPNQTEWHALNASISGQLIADTPVAASCYPGPLQNVAACEEVDDLWTNTTFQQNSPIGYSYPLYVPCPPVNASAGQQPGNCSLGNAPVYTVNATNTEQVAAGIAFAERNNIRLVIRDTGHDLLGRSVGFGSLQIWMRYIRTGVIYHEVFDTADWNGSAFTIGGGYVWSDVYPLASARNLVVVGGGTPTVGCIGGWMQGGGHSPATHGFGLGADQVLQARVVLANGSLVTASPKENKDLFFAIRGGGPGTYGVVVETTVKAWPTKKVLVQTLAFAPLADEFLPNFMEALTDLYAAYPDLSDAGWSGYGTWSAYSAVPIFGNFTIAYAHSIAAMGSSADGGQASFAPVLSKLQKYNGTSLFVSLTYTKEATYADYYNAFSGAEVPAGTLSAITSRFFDRPALTANRTALAQMLNITAGKSTEYTSNNIEFLGGVTSQIAADGNARPVSGLNPAWRTMVINQIVGRGWLQSTPQSTIDAIHHDLTYVKGVAMKKLAPHTGCYMNEADRLDPDWQQDFYGSHYERLAKIKKKYDCEDLFYCPTCVGSEAWSQISSGQLCRT